MRAVAAGVAIAVSLSACAGSTARPTARAPQAPVALPPPVELTAQQDHQRLMADWIGFAKALSAIGASFEVDIRLLW